MGVGIEAGGKFTVADVGIGTKAEASSTLEAGIHCTITCGFQGSATGNGGKFEPELNAPSIGDLRLEPTFEAFGFAEASVGNPFFQRIRFDALEMKAGVKLEGSFATKTSQLAATDYKSNYAVGYEVSAGLGTELDDVAQLLGVDSITGLEVKEEGELAESPAGVLSADNRSWLSGEHVTFTAHLSKVNFSEPRPLQREGGRARPDSAGNVTEVASQEALPSDTEFTFDYTAPDSGNSDEFHLFVVTWLVPFDLFSLELAQAKTEYADGIDNDGDTFVDFPADPNCESADDGSEAARECSDGTDNDGDGKTDYPSDTGCESDADATEAPNPQCSDESDNDGDGDTDYPSDPGCTELRDDSEAPNPQCSDDIDNDSDGDVDLDDPDCSSPQDDSEAGTGPVADISVEVTSAPSTVVSGQSISYSVKVTNNGPDPATHIEFNHSVGPQVGVSCTPAEGNHVVIPGLAVRERSQTFSGSGSCVRSCEFPEHTTFAAVNGASAYSIPVDQNSENDEVHQLVTVTCP